MNRADELREITHDFRLAHDCAKALSNRIANEIDAYADYLEAGGNVLDMVHGLRKAAQIAREYQGEGNYGSQIGQN